MKTYKRSMLSTLSHWKWLVSAEASLRALSCMQAKQAVRSSFSCWRLRHRASLKQTQMRTQMTGRCQQDLVASVRRWHCLVLRRLMASTHFYCLQAMMRLWHQVMKLSRVSRASKKQTVSDAFTLWRCLTMREIARRTQSKELITLAAYPGDGDSSMEVSDLLEVSATTYATNSGRDTSGEQCDTASANAALDINRSLSDLSGLSVHSPEPQPFGASPEPTAFEVSPIPFSPFSKVSPRSRSLAIPSPARSRQPTPDRSDGCDGCDGTDWCTPVTPVSRGAKLPDAASGCKHCDAKPGHGPDHWKSEAKMVQAELWQTERNERCLIEAMRCWLSQCLQRRLQILAASRPCSACCACMVQHRFVLYGASRKLCSGAASTCWRLPTTLILMAAALHMPATSPVMSFAMFLGTLAAASQAAPLQQKACAKFFCSSFLVVQRLLPLKVSIAHICGRGTCQAAPSRPNLALLANGSEHLSLGCWHRSQIARCAVQRWLIVRHAC